MKTIHASAVGRIFSCPASRETPEVLIGGDTEASALGTAIHRAMVTIASTGALPPDAVSLCPRECEPREFMRLCHAGLCLWRKYGQAITIHAQEQKYQMAVAPGWDLSGTPDLIGVTPNDQIAIVDYKSGWEERDATDQLMAYAMLDIAPPTQTSAFVLLITMRLRLGIVDIVEVNEQELMAWAKRLRDILAGPPRFNPTPENCLYCPRQHECPGRTQLVRATVSALAEPGQAMTPARAVTLYPQVQLLEKLAAQCRAAIRGVIELSGPQSLGDGRELALEESEREEILLAQGLDTILIALHTDRWIEIAPALKVIKTRLLDMIGEAAPRGQKGKAKAAFMDALREAGAVETTIVQALTIRRISERKEISDV